MLASGYGYVDGLHPVNHILIVQAARERALDLAARICLMFDIVFFVRKNSVHLKYS
jgi:hypothetical protein